MKHRILSIILLCFLLGATTNIIAQRGNGQWLESMAEELQLSEDQVASIEQIQKDFKAKFKELRNEREILAALPKLRRTVPVHSAENIKGEDYLQRLRSISYMQAI